MNGNGRQRIKQEFVNSFGNKCCVCKKSYPIVVYDFHHIDPNDKKFSISKGWVQNNGQLLEEIMKCVMVCSNCHRQINAGTKHVPKDAIRFKEKNIRHCKKFLL
jgi:hypothetical protein